MAGTNRVRALGTGHSFNRIADTPGALVSLARLPSLVKGDTQARTARVRAGLRYGGLGPALRTAGLALPEHGFAAAHLYRRRDRHRHSLVRVGNRSLVSVVVELVLDLVPTYDAAPTVVEGVSESLVADELSQVLAAAYGVSAFTGPTANSDCGVRGHLSNERPARCAVMPTRLHRDGGGR